MSTTTNTALARFKNLFKSVRMPSSGIPPVSHSKIDMELIKKCVGREDPTILEIGCNDGTHTRWFLEIFEKPKIYCFEPDPRAIARFKKQVGNYSNVSLFEMAVCDQDGDCLFFQSSGHHKKVALTESMPDGWDLSGSIRQPHNHLDAHKWVKFDQNINVSTTTLDTWCKNNGVDHIDFIWMDVQGAEIDVFRGGVSTLSRVRYIYTEYSNEELYKGQYNLEQLVEYLKNFSIVIRYPGDVLFRNKKLFSILKR